MGELSFLETSTLLTHIGLGVAGLVGIGLLLWILLAIRVFTSTKGLPQFISGFFVTLMEGKTDRAYQMTTPAFRDRVSQKKFAKWVKAKRLQQYKRTDLGLPQAEGDTYHLDLTIELQSGKKVPIQMDLVREDKTWKIDQLQI